jgi:hypothetical protein
MRKVDPTGVCEDFQSELDSLEEFYQASLDALKGKPNASSRASTLSELVFHRGYVALESFLSAYFIACINRDASTFLAWRECRIRQSVESKFGQWDEDQVDYTPPPHPSVAVISSLLDSQDRNVTFPDFARAIQRAQDWMTPAWAVKISATHSERRLIVDAAKAIRDCVAHQSQDSFSRINAALQALPDRGNAGLLRRHLNAVANVGSYLKAVQGGQTRTTIYLREFRDLAERLK